MVKIRGFVICLLMLIAPLSSVRAQEKPELTSSDLKKYTYEFDITEKGFSGPGADFLRSELTKRQFVLLGEYHGSLRISEFTKALVPVLHDAGWRTFALEVGPFSAERLTEFAAKPELVEARLREFNSRYYVKGKNRDFTPIPFFGDVEDAAFLKEAAKRKWNFIGLDQEFSFGYLPLTERLYENLDSVKKKSLKDLYVQVFELHRKLMEDSLNDGPNQFIAITESAEIQKFWRLAAENNPKNQRIVDALRTTTEIYRRNAPSVRKYFDANSDRIAYMKRNLAEGFARTKFDVRKDKLLLKMGAVHTGRGFSPLSLFEIGNTLSELADFHGNSSIHLNFGSRFYIENGREIDALDDKNGFLYRFRGLLQMGKRDQWVVIDLRPLREQVFYQRKFKIDEVVLDLFKNHDFFVICKLDRDPTPNYDKR